MDEEAKVQIEPKLKAIPDRTMAPACGCGGGVHFESQFVIRILISQFYLGVYIQTHPDATSIGVWVPLNFGSKMSKNLIR